MSVKLKELINPEFQASISSLRNNRDLKTSMTWKLLPIFKRIREEIENFNGVRIELCKKYAQKDKDENPIHVPLPDGNFQYIINPENTKNFEDELKDLQENEIDLPQPVVKISEIMEITKITVAELEYLVGHVLIGE